MHPLDVRRGVVGGTVVLLISAIGSATRSDTPLVTFVGTIAFGALVLLAATGVATVLNRPGPNLRW